MIDAVVCEVRFLQVMQCECHTLFESFLAFFPYFEKMKAGLCKLYAVHVSVYPCLLAFSNMYYIRTNS
jgi:hypothetical protein